LKLRSAVSRAVSLGVGLPSGAHDQIFVFCLIISGFFLWDSASNEVIECVIYSYSCFLFLPEQTPSCPSPVERMTIFYCLFLFNSEVDQVESAVFIVVSTRFHGSVFNRPSTEHYSCGMFPQWKLLCFRYPGSGCLIIFSPFILPPPQYSPVYALVHPTSHSDRPFFLLCFVFAMTACRARVFVFTTAHEPSRKCSISSHLYSSYIRLPP
jgi:hypothetical protein